MAAKGTSKKKASTTTKTHTEHTHTTKDGTSQNPVWSRVSFIITVLIAIVAAGVLVWIVASSLLPNTNDPVVASVNGQPIYQSEVLLAYQRLPQEMREVYTPEIILNQTIDKTLLLQEAAAQGIEVTDVEVAARIEEQAASLNTATDTIRQALEQSGISWDEYEQAVREEITLLRYVDEVTIKGVQVSDAQIQAYYAQNINQFTAQEGQRRIRHILVESEEEANEIYDLAVSGQDFAVLAQARSIGPSAPDGGNLGFVDENTPFVEPFLSTALALEELEVSEPVQTQFGWHVIYRDSSVIPIREARAQIGEILAEESAKQVFAEKIEELRQNAEITLLRDIDFTTLV